MRGEQQGKAKNPSKSLEFEGLKQRLKDSQPAERDKSIEKVNKASDL